MSVIFFELLHIWEYILLPQLINSSFISSHFALLGVEGFQTVPETMYVLMREGTLREAVSLCISRVSSLTAGERLSGYLIVAWTPFTECRDKCMNGKKLALISFWWVVFISRVSVIFLILPKHTGVRNISSKKFTLIWMVSLNDFIGFWWSVLCLFMGISIKR